MPLAISMAGVLKKAAARFSVKTDRPGIINSFLGPGYLGVPDAEGGGGKLLRRLGVHVRVIPTITIQHPGPIKTGKNSL
jgi:hypothetical protein